LLKGSLAGGGAALASPLLASLSSTAAAKKSETGGKLAFGASAPEFKQALKKLQSLLGDDGVIIECDKRFKFKYINKKNVDKVKPNLVADAIHKCAAKKWNIRREDLSISTVAEQYYNFFLSIV